MIRQRQNPLSFRAVIEGAEASDLIEAAHPVQRIEIMCVTSGKLACLEVTATEIFVAKSLRALARKKMEAQPPPVSSRHSLRFPKKSDEQNENKIGIHLRLKLKVAREIFRRDLARAAFKLQRGV